MAAGYVWIMAGRHAKLSLALLLVFIPVFFLLYGHLTPPYSTFSIYFTVVVGMLMAAKRAASKWYLLGACVLGAFWIWSTLTYTALPNNLELIAQGLGSVLVFAYFFWQTRQVTTEDEAIERHLDFHIYLTVLAGITTFLYFLTALQPLLPLGDWDGYRWFKTINNVVFNIQILLLTVFSRARVIAHSDRAAWRKASDNLTSGNRKPLKLDGAIQGGWGFQPLQDDVGKDGPTILMERLAKAFGEKMGRKGKRKNSRANR